MDAMMIADLPALRYFEFCLKWEDNLWLLGALRYPDTTSVVFGLSYVREWGTAALLEGVGTIINGVVLKKALRRCTIRIWGTDGLMIWFSRLPGDTDHTRREQAIKLVFRGYKDKDEYGNLGLLTESTSSQQSNTSMSRKWWFALRQAHMHGRTYFERKTSPRGSQSHGRGRQASGAGCRYHRGRDRSKIDVDVEAEGSSTRRSCNPEGEGSGTRAGYSFRG